MKKSFFFIFAFLFVALACVTFSACGQTEKNSVEDGENISAVTEDDQEVSANYSYDYDNWYEFGKNNDVTIDWHGSSTSAVDIGNAEQLGKFLYNVNNNKTDSDVAWRTFDVYITADIDMSRLKWVPLGTHDNPYTGYFYGQNHYISGLNITGENNDNAMAGFFGKVTGYIQDITVDVYIDSECGSGSKVGGLAAYSDYCWFRNCAVRGTIKYLPEYDRWWVWATYFNDYVGGIVGYCCGSGVQITNCVNYATITRKDSRNNSTSCIGGIVGYGEKCYINSCLNLGAIDKKGSNFAGIAGKIKSGSIIACSDYGNVNKKNSEFSHIHGYTTDDVSCRNNVFGDNSYDSPNRIQDRNDDYYNSDLVWTNSCYDNNQFSAWRSICVPKSVIHSFNISFGWDSPNGSGYFSETNNAMYAIYNNQTVYGTSGEAYKYEYVIGTIYSHSKVDIIIKNGDMFSYSKNTVSGDENEMFYSQAGFLYYTNKVLMEEEHSNKKITFHSKSKTLTIEAKNCKGATNGNKYTITRDLYYHDTVSENIYASRYYSIDKDNNKIKTEKSGSYSDEGYSPYWSGNYVKLDCYTGQSKITITDVNPISYSYSVVFTDRVNKDQSKIIENVYYTYEDYEPTTELYSSDSSGSYNNANFGFSIVIKKGANLISNPPSGFSVDGNILNTNFSSYMGTSGIVVYVNYGYTGDNLLAVSPGEDYCLPFTTKEYANLNNISDLCDRIGKQLDVGYKVYVNNSQDESTKITTTTIKVTDEFTENGAQGCYYRAEENSFIFSFTCTSYAGYAFTEVEGVDEDNKVVKNDKDTVAPITLKFNVTGFTITHENTELVSIYRYQDNKIVNPSQEGWYEKVGDTNTFVKTTDKIWIKDRKIYYYQNGNQVDAGKYYYTANDKAKYHSLIVIAANEREGEKCVGITCNRNVVTLESYYLFVVDPVAHTLSSDFELEFKALYVDEASYGEISAPTKLTTNHYEITSKENLMWLASEVNNGRTFENYTFVQKNDIDLSDTNYIPIGNEDNVFKGTYDGGNHSISNIKFNSENSNLDENGFVGLFGNVENATIKNLTVKDSNFIGNRYVGAFVGKATNSTFYNLNAYNCTVSVTEFEYYDVYGTKQLTEKITYQDSIDTRMEVTSQIYTKERVGFAGVVGNASSCSFTGVSFNTGSITSTKKTESTEDNGYLPVGSFIGVSENNVTISQCYVDCTVENVSNFVANNSEFTATDYYFNNIQVEKTNEGNWMTLGDKEVLKFFYWVV